MLLSLEILSNLGDDDENSANTDDDGRGGTGGGAMLLLRLWCRGVFFRRLPGPTFWTLIGKKAAVLGLC